MEVRLQMKNQHSETRNPLSTIRPLPFRRRAAAMFWCGAVLVVLLTRSTMAGELVPVQFGIASDLGETGQSELRTPTGLKLTPKDRVHWLDAARALGITTMRDNWGWASIEPERGKGYRFELHDDLARKASERGIEILGLIYACPEWATGEPPAKPSEQVHVMAKMPRREFEPDFRRFVHAVVARYSGRRPESLPLKRPIRNWIFSNEQDCGGSPPDEYAFWLKAFYEEVKAVDPDAKVSPQGPSNGCGAYFETMLASKNLQGPAYPYFDFVNFHAYTGASVPLPNFYGITQISTVINSQLGRHNLKADLWITEIASWDGKVDHTIKTLVHAASTGVKRLYLFALGPIPGAWEHGTLENTPSGQVPVRRPLFTAYRTLLRKIGQNEGVQFLSPGRYLVRLPGGKMVFVVWAADATATKLDLPVFCPGQIRVTDLQGKQQETDGIRLVLTDHPVFVEPIAQQRKAQ
jgi:hypothetical protein